MNFGNLIKQVRDLEKKTDAIYVYGAGFYGKDICKILARNKINIAGFMVTDAENEKKVLGFPVVDAKSVMHKNVGIVFGLNDTYLKKVKDYLKKNNVDFGRCIDGGKYLFEVNGREMIRNRPIIEVTTIMGCRIDCRFCPQEVLLENYFKEDKKRKKMMTPGDFKLYIKNTPKNCDFIIAGMSEPFLNPHCLDFLKMSCDSGRQTSLYTTLIGAKRKDVIELLSLPLHFVALHVADRNGYAHIPLTKEYYESIEMVINAKREDGYGFVNTVNSQSEPDERIEEICKGKYEILTSLHDRAGNLKDEALVGRKKPFTSEKIYCCSCGTELNNQVLLPDGTLVLCNMDFGLQHQLGNLLVDDYNTIRSGQEMQNVRNAMSGNTDINLLCRKCCLSRIAEE